MSRRLPVRLPTRSALARVVRRWDGGGAPERLVALAREQGLSPIAVLAGPSGQAVPGDAPTLILVHEPAPPEKRAALYPLASGLGPVLLLSSREWEVWSDGVLGRLTAPTSPVWGQPLPVPDEDDDERRRRQLRQAADLYWTRLPAALHRDARPGEASRVAEGLRSLCSRLTPPSRFPPVPAQGADGDAILAASFGVAHATFAGEVATDVGQPLPPEARWESEPSDPSGPALDRLGGALVADLPSHFASELRALYLVPGPWGTRHANQLLAVVAEDAPLHRAAALRRRLAAHLGLLPRDLLAGALLAPPGPVVVSEPMLHGQLRRRLFRRPLRRLSIRLGARRLLGEDVFGPGLAGPDFAPSDLRAEVAALATATGAAFCSGSAADARDLVFGAWPRALALISGRSPLESLQGVHADLAGRTDRALSRVGSAARAQPWGDPLVLDRGRSAPFLREWGPALIRLQEFALEVLE